ncbi:IS66 family transposase [Bradyrhizobium elkanii]|uniref:IS66 family transposase n=1 Tax=Bradyrhizobium elkanii TaxID=29448 RepID=UPI003BAADF6A
MRCLADPHSLMHAPSGSSLGSSPPKDTATPNDANRCVRSIAEDEAILFLRDGRVEVDSNTTERTMRPIAMRRPNSCSGKRSRRRELGDPSSAREHGKAS